jgi:DNA topoisomerase IB
MLGNSDMTAEQVARARDLAPQMVDTLAAWISLEATLGSQALGFDARLRAFGRMRSTFEDAQRLLARVMMDVQPEAAP